MRILLVHNHYGSAAPSGENLVFELERKLLQRYGHEVMLLERHSDEIRKQGALGKVRGAVATPWSPSTFRRVRRVVADFKPHVVHAHNTFPLLSPSVFSAAAGAARVLTLHNYRLLCAAAIPLRDGKVCTDCIDRRSVLPSLRHGCYRGSRLATAPLAANILLHQAMGTWTKHVEAFVALTEFQRRRFVEYGFAPERIHVKPNFYPGDPGVVDVAARHPRAVFVGRLSDEKGVSDLIEAWSRWATSAPELIVVGDGPLRPLLEDRIPPAMRERIKFVGQVSAEEAQAYIATARLLIVPSTSFEGFPMVLREAFAFGTPVMVTRLGPLPELVAAAEGGVFLPGDPGDLLGVAQALWNDESRIRRMSTAMRREFDVKYTEKANYELLMKIYDRAIALAKTRRGDP